MINQDLTAIRITLHPMCMYTVSYYALLIDYAVQNPESAIGSFSFANHLNIPRMNVLLTMFT